MDIEEQRKVIRRALGNLRLGPHSCDGKTPYPLVLSPESIDAILKELDRLGVRMGDGDTQFGCPCDDPECWRQTDLERLIGVD